MQLRKATVADDEAIRAVITTAFPDNPKRRAEITAWQYWSNPFGETCVWVWDDDGRIAATYANYPMPAVLGGQPSLAGNGVDAAVDPEYQGRGLFEPLARALYEDSATHGIAVTMCFINNPLAIRGTTKAGWLEVGQLGVWVWPVDPGWLAQRAHLPRRAGKLMRTVGWHVGTGSVADIGTEVPRHIDRVWARGGCVTTGVVRGQPWWDWRYGAHPDHPYTFFSTDNGAAVGLLKEAFGGRFLYLLELLADDEHTARAIVRAALRHAEAADATGVALLALPRTRLAAHARAAGFRRVPERFDPKPTSFGAVPNLPAHAGLQALDWSVSWGDLDHL